MDALDRYAELCAKVEKFFDRVSQSHGPRMRCDDGCSDCCHVTLEPTSVEAAAIDQHLASLDDEQQQAFERHLETVRARADGDPRCSALDDGGRCTIYPARPLVCRSHGVPIRLGQELADDGRTHLPIVDVCFRNFQGELDQVPPTDMLDQNTISTILFAIDAVHAAEVGETRGRRRAMVEVLGLMVT